MGKRSLVVLSGCGNWAMTRTATSSATASPSMIRQAITLHQQGQLDKAERLYTRILHDQHNHFDALHLLGVLMHQCGRSGTCQ